MSAATGAGTYAWVDDDAALRRGRRRSWPTADVYGLDTEFHRERTYHARLALLQLVVAGRRRRRRPARRRRRPRWPRCSTAPGLCVMHAASQDLEILARVCGTRPEPAVRHPGGGRVRRLQQRRPGRAGAGRARACSCPRPTASPTGWPARCPRAPSTYAAADVAHLHELHDRLVAKLEARGRLQWALDECEVHRTRAASGQRRPSGPGGASRRPGRCAAGRRRWRRSLAAWRERRAAEVDRPGALPAGRPGPRGDGPAPAVHRGRPAARARPRRGQAQGRRRPRAARRRSPRAWRCPLEDVQVPPVGGRRPQSRRAAASLVSAWAAQRARDLDIDAAILATRADIEALLMGDGGRLATAGATTWSASRSAPWPRARRRSAVDPDGPARARDPLGRARSSSRPGEHDGGVGLEHARRTARPRRRRRWPPRRCPSSDDVDRRRRPMFTSDRALVAPPSASTPVRRHASTPSGASSSSRSPSCRAGDAATGGEQAPVEVQHRARVGPLRLDASARRRRAGTGSHGSVAPAVAGAARSTGRARGSRRARRGRRPGRRDDGVLEAELLAGVEERRAALREQRRPRRRGPGPRCRRSGCGGGGCRGWTAPRWARRPAGRAAPRRRGRSACATPRRPTARGWRRS